MCMDLKGIMLTEISQMRKTNTTFFHLYVESKNKNKWNRNKLIDTQNKLSCQMGGRLGEKGEVINKYKLVDK